MYILGISCFYHDASAALLKDGKIVAAAEEERFTRIKHDPSFPINAINFCLKSQNITIDKIDYIGFYEKPLVKFERMMFQHLEYFPLSYKIFLSSIPSWINEKLRIPNIIKSRLKYKGDIIFIEHHMAHAASSFLISPFEKAASVTVDGVGEWTTTAYGIGEKKKIRLQKEIRFPHSIGLLYSAITAYLGFTVNNSEYKVMGLSSYGNMDIKSNRFYRKFKQVVDIKDDGSYCFDMSYFTYQYANRMPSVKLCKLLDGPIRKKAEKITQRHMDIAAALQLITEEILTKILRHVHNVTKCENLVMGGGVALNSVFNGKIISTTPFKKVWIQPNATDGGTSIGAASYVYNVILGHPRNYVFDNAYLGPEFSREEIKLFLDKNNVRYTIFRNEDELIKKTAYLIHNNNIIGLFQGKMEWGPRALGNRSILANPCNPDMKDILNKKVKHREEFRPFAPAVCDEDVYTYFDCDMPIPEPAEYMLMVYPIKKEYQKKIPSVTHIDCSGRLQVVKRNKNPLYYDLIKEFGRLSGIPVLINTSFNVNGEPIVCTPEDAFKCFMGTGIDYLVIGKFLIRKSDNLKGI